MKAKVELAMINNNQFSWCLEHNELKEEDVYLIHYLEKELTFGNNKVTVTPLSELEKRTGIKNVDSCIGRLIDQELLVREGDDYYIIAPLEVQFYEEDEEDN